MKRNIFSDLRIWKETQQRRKPILLRGARQVGKTYLVRQLGELFESFVELNLERDPASQGIFELDFDPHRIIRDISLLKDSKINPGTTLLFIDEIQEAPKAITALRYFYEEIPDLHVIAAGSLVDFALEKVGIPVGRVSMLHLYPLSFLEFLQAQGFDLAAEEIEKHPVSQEISKPLHDKFLRYLGEYFAVGGMPESVNCWIETKDPRPCQQIQQELVATYQQDFQKYASRRQLPYVDLLFREIPRLVGQPFKYSDIPGNYRKRDLAPCLELLLTAGVVHKIQHTSAQGLPLMAGANPDKFKLILLDVALTQSALGLAPGEWCLDPITQFLNKGAIAEAFIGQELLAYSNPHRKMDLNFWKREARSSTAEIDYLIEKKGEIVPVEVKSGKGTALKSMHLFLKQHPHVNYGIRFSTHNFSLHKNLHSYPLYAASNGFSDIS